MHMISERWGSTHSISSVQCGVLHGHQHNEVLFSATRSHASFQVYCKLSRRLSNVTLIFFCNVIRLVDRGGWGGGGLRGVTPGGY